MARSKQQDTLIELLNQEEVRSLCHATLSEHVKIVRCGDETTRGDVMDVRPARPARPARSSSPVIASPM